MKVLLVCLYVCRILLSVLISPPVEKESNWYCSWEGDRQSWKLDAFTFSCFHFISFCFFKSMQQLKRQEESIMQIMSLCIMSHDWNMQMGCIIYECQCLSKSVSHNLQSESERHGEGSSSNPTAKESLYFPASAPW